MPLTSPRFAGNARLQSAADNKPPLKKGEPKGRAVELVQQALVDLSYKMPISFKGGKPDGIYGDETTRVVRQFQIDQGFAPDGWDGRAGRDTLTRLDQLFPPPRPVPPAPPPPPPPIPPRRGHTPPVPIRPDKGKLLFSERNVDLTGGLKWDAAYDLALFEELGNPRRGVLVVTVICSFKFKDGNSTKGPSLGSKLTWPPGEKQAYMSGFKLGVERVWSEQHRITIVGTAPRVTDVGVLFEVQGAEDLSVFRHSHWNLHITKVDAGVTSNVEDGGGLITNGDANLDSLDLLPEDKGGPVPMVPAIHEFGHMIGYRDEYVGKGGVVADNPNHTSDLDSIMNRSATVRERHYVLLADWLTRQSDPGVVWRVNGVTDMTNAKI